MPKKLITHDVYSRIKELILSNTLGPRQKCLDRELAKELGVSRTPVREVLNRLERDGLVINRPGKGYYVADEMDAGKIAELYELREILETNTIRLAAERATPADLKDLQRTLAKLDEHHKDPAGRADEIKTGFRVHELIARASGNAFLHESVVRLLDRMCSFIWMQTLNMDSEAAELDYREHNAFLPLIREKRADEAEAAIRDHIREGKKEILKLVRARESFAGRKTVTAKSQPTRDKEQRG